MTHHLLNINNIYPDDMWSDNIFIHWLNENSYFNDECIKDIEDIIYKINNKFYKIKTFGFVIVLGDVGMFNIKVKKDVLVIGSFFNIKENYKLLDMKLKPEYTNYDFIKFSFYLILNLLTPEEFTNTIAFKILNTEPYNNFPNQNWHLFGYELSHLKKLKSTFDLLSFFDEKYCIKNYSKTKNNILIKIC